MNLLEKAIRLSFLTPTHDPKHPNMRWGVALFLEGDPGIGKSYRVEEAARSLGLAPCVTVTIASRSPEDVGSAMCVSPYDGSRVAITQIPGVDNLRKVGSGVLFMDELNCAGPRLQNAFLSVLSAGIIGDERLPPGVRIISAGNDPMVSAAQELTIPMSNRLVHLPVKEDLQSFVAHHMTPYDGTVNAVSGLEQTIVDNWDKYVSAEKAAMCGFLQATMGDKDNNYFHSPPKEGDKIGAWPSGRSWTVAMHISTTGAIIGEDPRVTRSLMAGCIGEPAVLAFAEWRRLGNIPTPSDMINHVWLPSAQRLDIAMAAYEGLAYYVRTVTKSPQGVDKDFREHVIKEMWRNFQQCVDAGLSDIIAKGTLQGVLKDGLKDPVVTVSVLAAMQKGGVSNLLQKYST